MLPPENEERRGVSWEERTVWAEKQEEEKKLASRGKGCAKDVGQLSQTSTTLLGLRCTLRKRETETLLMTLAYLCLSLLTYHDRRPLFCIVSWGYHC